MSGDILARLTRWYDRVPSDSVLFGCSSKLLDDAAEADANNAAWRKSDGE